MRYLLHCKSFCFFCLVGCLFASSCKVEDEMNPLESSEEHTTLACKINGEEWLPAGGDLFSGHPYSLHYYSYDGFLILNAGNSSESAILHGSISMGANNIRIGSNNLIENDSNWYIQNLKISNECRHYEDLEMNFGNHISISKIDSLDFYMEGTFQFTAINECNDTVRVTDGYFDLSYRF